MRKWMFHVEHARSPLDAVFHVKQSCLTGERLRANFVPRGTAPVKPPFQKLPRSNHNVPRETSCILELPLLDFRWQVITWLESSRSQIKKAEWAKQPRL